MIPTITDHQLISSSDLRKYHDSPLLWIIASIGSLSLHLLIFLLIQSSNNFQSSLLNSNQDIVPIDFIDISNSSISKKTGKPNITKKTIEKQSNSSVSVNKPSLENNDDPTIASSFQSTPKNQISAPEVQKNQTIKPNNTKTPKSEELKNPTTKPSNNSKTPKPAVKKTPINNSENNQTQKNNFPIKQQTYPAFTNTPKPKATIPENEKPWNRRQNIKLGEEKPLPKDILPESSSTDQRKDRGGAIATVTPLIKKEINELIQQRQLIVDALPDNLPEYKGSKTKDIDITLLPNNVILKPANIFASLIIDKNGNFQQALVISIEPISLRSDKNIYEQAINQIFQQSDFSAAYNQDGSKPDFSNLYVRLKIQLANSE